MASFTSILSLSFCLLFISQTCLATFQGQEQQQPRLRAKTQCNINRLTAQEPNRQFQSEAGVTEFWERNDELECAGVEAYRKIVQPKGLLLPYYTNAPQLIYIVQGRGVHGTVIPGCANTYEMEMQSGERGQQGGRSFTDRHQKVRRFQQGDILALPAGVTHWAYNDGEEPFVSVSLVDTSNHANQLDNNFRKFFLAGNPFQQGVQQGRHEWQQGKRGQQQQQGQQEQAGGNIFSGLDDQILAESFNVDVQTIQNLKGQNDHRGSIVRAENFQFIRPQREQEEQQQQQEEEEEYMGGRSRSDNGLEETFCSMRLLHSISTPARADVFNPRGGRISHVNSQKLPILNYLQLSAERGILYRNAIRAPHWNVNAHNVIYIIRGSGRLQVVGNRGTSVFDDQVKEGQLIVVPQNFAAVKQAGNDGLEWVGFQTNDNTITSQLAGRVSAIRSLPEEVLMNSYGISREDARNLKYNRQESTLFSPRF